MATTTSTRHLEATRTAILSAAADLFLARDGASFSVREVADRAGVTHRTVYRHFPARADLLIATASKLGSDVGHDDTASPSTVDEWIIAAGHRFHYIEGRLGLLRDVSAAIMAADEVSEAGQRIPEADDPRWQVFRREFSHLDDAEAIRAFAGLRHVLSSVSYYFLRARFGLRPEEARTSLCETASRIVDGLRRPSHG